MNAYFCDAGEQDVLQEYIAGYPRYESSFVCDLVFAPTRGKAKSMFLHHADCKVRGGLEFTEVKACTVSKNVLRQHGIADLADPLWSRLG